MTEAVIVERRGEIAIVTMNIPAKRNAVGRAIYTGLQRTFEELQLDNTLRALVFTGGKHFCGGGDLGDLTDPPLDFRRGMAIGHRAVKAIAHTFLCRLWPRRPDAGLRIAVVVAATRRYWIGARDRDVVRNHRRQTSTSMGHR